jgi:nucleotide-binding universal stress UspA family protein
MMRGAIVDTPFSDLPFSDVVVPLDGSPAAERALTPALDLVRRAAVPLRLLSRCFPDEQDAVGVYLSKLATRCGDVIVSTSAVTRDSIPDAILGELGPASLVCMTSHGRGGLARAVMGSIAEALLRALDRPALVVGPHVTTPAFAGRVVACVDGSDESELTLAPARAWADMTGEPLWLLEVDAPRDPDDPLPRGIQEGGHLAALSHRVAADGWDVLHGRHPGTALAEAAADPSVPTGLLVVANHGRTGWDRLHMGSVTAAVVHQAPVPVLVVPTRAARARQVKTRHLVT